VVVVVVVVVVVLVVWEVVAAGHQRVMPAIWGYLP